MHPAFDPALWEELRLDIDPHAKPDIVGSVLDMRLTVDSQSQDAIWCSHILEHLYSHEVPVALAEFQRVLKPDGFALITCPVLETVADLILSKGLDNEAHQSPAGSISSLDMLYGHSRSIAGGRTYMAHRTGFTCPRLGQLLIDARFSTALAKRDRFDLWALALMPIANQERIQQDLKHRGLDMFDDGA